MLFVGLQEKKKAEQNEEREKISPGAALTNS
jgi:hypothetical protein